MINRKLKCLTRLVPLLLIMVSGLVHADWKKSYHIDGYDPVSYFNGTGPLLGDPEYTLKYGGGKYAFSSMENLNEFSMDPERYTPAYDGNCALSMAHGKESSIDPLVWEIVDERLFFLINHSTKKRWNRKSSKYIIKGDRSWQRIFASGE